MTLTIAQLNTYCGESPAYTLKCPYCRRRVGPYHAQREAQAALTTHLLWVHYPGELKTFGSPRS